MESSGAALFGSQPSFSSLALETCLVMELRTSRTKDSKLDPPLLLTEEQDDGDDDEGLLLNLQRKLLFLCSLHEHTLNTCTERVRELPWTGSLSILGLSSLLMGTCPDSVLAPLLLSSCLQPGLEPETLSLMIHDIYVHQNISALYLGSMALEVWCFDP